MHRPVIFFTLFLAVFPASAIQIVEFCPDPYMRGDPDEYIILEGSGNLEGVMISDGEGGLRFPKGAVIEGKLTLARNGPAFEDTTGTVPDYEWYDYSPNIPDFIRSGTFQMANEGDELRLYADGRTIQDLSWPGELRARQGQVHFLDQGEWDPRVLMQGQSRFAEEEFFPVNGIVFSSPDCSLAVFEEFVASAEKEIKVNVYEFSNPSMVRSLVDANNKGVGVAVLVEGGPVGGISLEEQRAIADLKGAGIPVWLMTSGNEAHAPYRFDHAKYLIIDECRVLVTSENFKSSGFPKEGYSGNRGWGAVLENDGIAGYFSEIFVHDSSGGWCTQAAFTDGLTEYSPQDPYHTEFSPYRFENAKVIPVVSPDTSYLISDLIADSLTTLDIEQAYITNQSDGSFNPFLEEAIGAARRGVHVRILLDSYYYNTEGPEDNDEMVSCINRLATDDNLPIEARLADLEESNIEKIHNKGVIADESKVLISSINWNDNSPNFNRETGVIIEHEGVGHYFTEVFNDDWAASDAIGLKQEMDWLRIGLALFVLMIIGLLAFIRRKIWF